MTQTPTLLAVLLDRRGLDRYGSFRPAYEKAARAIDPKLGHSAPSRAQFHRWTTGALRGLPYTDHCRVLEHMLSGYTAAQLFQPCPDRALPPPERASQRRRSTRPRRPSSPSRPWQASRPSLPAGPSSPPRSSRSR